MVKIALKNTLDRLENALIEAEYHEIDIYQSNDTVPLSFRQRKFSSHKTLVNSSLQLLDSRTFELLSSATTPSRKPAINFILHQQKLQENYVDKDIRGMISEIQKMKQFLSKVSVNEIKTLQFKKPSLPLEIQEEIHADLEELQRCFNSQCYRSAVILCGRMLEAALHRKYYETTHFDILEKNPGIGLGTLIAKLVDKGVKLDPGLTQQIHLINNVRIFSVHKKLTPFRPSKIQAHAVILFTLDTLEKLF